MTLAEIEALAGEQHLAVFGGFHPDPEDGAPEGSGTLVLLGPDEPGFWDHLQRQREFRDGRADPLDRWSRRIIGALADELGAMPLFPFEGPPYRPFFGWGARTRRAWPSPVTLLVHDRAGLMVSYRGALSFAHRLALPDPPAEVPCKACQRPCVTACPAAALTDRGYDVAACHAYLDTPQGQSCLQQGCAVRRACPLGRSYGRHPEQSAFHMSYYHP